MGVRLLSLNHCCVCTLIPFSTDRTAVLNGNEKNPTILLPAVSIVHHSCGRASSLVQPAQLSREFRHVLAVLLRLCEFAAVASCLGFMANCQTGDVSGDTNKRRSNMHAIVGGAKPHNKYKNLKKCVCYCCTCISQSWTQKPDEIPTIFS